MTEKNFKQSSNGTIFVGNLLVCLIAAMMFFLASQTAVAAAFAVELNWTAPGDDGNNGTATAYDVRYATSPLTEANWDAAVQAEDEPTPQAAGNAESFIVSGLSPSTTYYFGIKSVDDSENWSEISNIISASTDNETDSPSDIANLALSEITGSSMRLTWSAPGDDSTSGTASEHDIRYSSSPITIQNWNAATQVSNEPAPAVAGTEQTMVVSELESGTVYYFAMRTADEVPNWSGLSNVVNGTTLDIVAPAAIEDLQAFTGENAGELAIGWTSPGDDSLLGTAHAYLVKVSTSMITEANWDSALTITNDPPSPMECGSVQGMIVSGLQPAELYYIALKSCDEAENYSAISNVDTAHAMFNYGSDIDDPLAEIPDEFQLQQNYPNPFNPSTNISFGLPQDSNVRLEIYNMLGKMVIMLADQNYSAGYHNIIWDGYNDRGLAVSSGIYLYRLVADNFVSTKKMMLVK